MSPKVYDKNLIQEKYCVYVNLIFYFCKIVFSFPPIPSRFVIIRQSEKNAICDKWPLGLFYYKSPSMYITLTLSSKWMWKKKMFIYITLKSMTKT